MLSLRCIHCGKALTLSEKEAFCVNNHHFDRARQGYFYLSRKQVSSRGDNKESIQARQAFLEAGFYDFLAQEVIVWVGSKKATSLLDLACGTGFYLKKIVDSLSLEDSFGLDLSKEGIKIASRQDPKSQYVVASMTDCPFFDHSFDLILTMFAPKLSQEPYRLLKEGGSWLVVDVGVDHLFEMKEVLYPEPTKNIESLEEFEGFDLVNDWHCGQRVTIHQPYLSQLFEMTPYRYTTSPQVFDRILTCPSLDLHLSFHLKEYRKKGL